MEFSSGEGYHISRFAKLYEGVDFWASEADDWSCENLRTISSTATAEDSDATSSEGQEKVSDEVKGGKIQKIVQLDFLVAEQWEDLIASLARSSAGDGGDGKKSGEGDVEQTLDEEAKLSGIWGINFLHMIPLYVPILNTLCFTQVSCHLARNPPGDRQLLILRFPRFQPRRTGSDLLSTVERAEERRRMGGILRAVQAR